jgi:hypothetical protein
MAKFCEFLIDDYVTDNDLNYFFEKENYYMRIIRTKFVYSKNDSVDGIKVVRISEVYK